MISPFWALCKNSLVGDLYHFRRADCFRLAFFIVEWFVRVVVENCPWTPIDGTLFGKRTGQEKEKRKKLSRNRSLRMLLRWYRHCFSSLRFDHYAVLHDETNVLKYGYVLKHCLLRR